MYLTLLELLARGKTLVNGETLSVPDGFQVALTQSEYDFSRLSNVTYEKLNTENYRQCTHLLNSSKEIYWQFLKGISWEKETQLINEKESQGILALHAGKELTVCVTQNLAKPGMWARFFAQAIKI